MLRLFLALALIATTALPSYADRPNAFKKCRLRGVRTNCVIDGDSVFLNGIYTRMGDYDTPEGQYRCNAEKVKGDLATKRLLEILNSGPVETRPWRIKRDRHRNYDRASRPSKPRQLRVVIIHPHQLARH